MKVYDVLTIGGGIIGASIAYHISKTGLEAGLLEASTIASETSSKCDGNILLIDKEPGFDSNMAIKSQYLFKELSDELEMEFEYRQPGSIFLCENDEELKQAYDWADHHNQENGTHLFFNKLTKEDLKNDSKYFSDHLVGGIECTNDATVNPYMLTFSFIHEAKKNHTDIIENTPVTSIERLSDGTFKVFSNERMFKTKKLINAAGVWAPEISRHLGVELPIIPRKGQILVSSRTELMGTRKIQEFGYLMTKFGKKRKAEQEMNDYGIALVHEPTESQNFLLGSSREFVGYDTSVNHRVIQLIAQRAIHFFPKMKDINIIRTYGGLRPWTPDNLPIISDTNVSNYYIAAGHEGDGIGLSAITGRWISELVTGNLNDDLRPLNLSRFEGVSL